MMDVNTVLMNSNEVNGIFFECAMQIFPKVENQIQ